MWTYRPQLSILGLRPKSFAGNILRVSSLKPNILQDIVRKSFILLDLGGRGYPSLGRLHSQKLTALDEFGTRSYAEAAVNRSVTAFWTLSERACMSCPERRSVGIGAPTRISSGWHLMW